MKNKMIALALLITSITGDIPAANQHNSWINKENAMNTLKIGGVCFVVLFGFFYGGKKYKQYQERASIERCNAWLKANDLSSLEEMDNKNKRLTEFSEELTQGAERLTVNIECIRKNLLTMMTQAQSSEFRSRIGKKAYTQLLANIKTLSEYLKQYPSRQQATA